MRVKLIKEDGGTFAVICRATRRDEQGSAIATQVAQKDVASAIASGLAEIRQKKLTASPGEQLVLL